MISGLPDAAFNDVELVDRPSGYKIHAKRTSLGHWCGYLYLPRGHPWHGTTNELDVDVHGGITYANLEPDRTWCIGFDCAHLGDRVPCMDSRPGETYRDLDFVKHELHKLAEQAMRAQEAAT